MYYTHNDLRFHDLRKGMCDAICGCKLRYGQMELKMLSKAGRKPGERNLYYVCCGVLVFVVYCG